MTRNFTLDISTIDVISNTIYDYLTEQKVEHRQALSIRLTAEDTLSKIYEAMPGIEIGLNAKKRFGNLSIEIAYKGNAFDPSPDQEDEENSFSSLLLQNLGLSPSWTYRGGVNRIQFRLSVKSSMSSLTAILTAIAAALLLGLLLGRFIPDTLRTGLNDVLLSPAADAFLGLLRTFAGIMVLLTIITGIAGIGDIGSLGRIGRTVFPKFFLGILLVSIATAAGSVLVFRPTAASAGAGSSQLQEISQMIFGILPTDPISPFQSGNILQVIVIAILAGIVILGMGEQGKRVAASINDLSTLVQSILAIICRLIPVFVFLSLLRMIWGGSAQTIVQLWKPLLVIAAMNILFALVLLLAASISLRLSPALILRKALPSMMEALTTGSCMAAFPGAVKRSRKELGIDQHLLDFGFPIGIVLYMPAIAITFTTLIVYLASLYGISINTSWLIMGVITSALLSCALPPIPGASLTCYSILLAQMGLPVEGVVLAATMDILADRIAAGFIILDLMLDLLPDAKKLDMIDMECCSRNSN